MTRLEYSYLLEAVRTMARAACERHNCGSVCLCGGCSARKVLPTIESKDFVERSVDAGEA